MLTLILINVQYSQTAVFRFEKGPNCQNHSSPVSHHPAKPPPSSVHYFLTKSPGNSLSFRWKGTVTLYWNLGSEHLLTSTLLTKLLASLLYYVLYCSLFFYATFWKTRVKLNGLVVKALDSQSRNPVFKINGWIQGQLSLSSFWGW